MTKFVVLLLFGIMAAGGLISFVARLKIANRAAPGKEVDYFVRPTHSWNSLEEVQKELGPASKGDLDMYKIGLVLTIMAGLALAVFAIVMQVLIK